MEKNGIIIFADVDPVSSIYHYKEGDFDQLCWKINVYMFSLEQEINLNEKQ